MRGVGRWRWEAEVRVRECCARVLVRRREAEELGRWSVVWCGHGPQERGGGAGALEWAGGGAQERGGDAGALERACGGAQEVDLFLPIYFLYEMNRLHFFQAIACVCNFLALMDLT